MHHNFTPGPGCLKTGIIQLTFSSLWTSHSSVLLHAWNVCRPPSQVPYLSPPGQTTPPIKSKRPTLPLFYKPVLGQCVVDQLVLVTLPGHVSSEAEERGDVDSVDMLCALNIAAQIKLCENTLPRLLLKKKKKKKKKTETLHCCKPLSSMSKRFADWTACFPETR